MLKFTSFALWAGALLFSPDSGATELEHFALITDRYHCNYENDASRGIKSVRAVLRTTRDENGYRSACIRYYRYDQEGAPLSAPACGRFNTTSGIRSNADGVKSARFDGFENFIRVSSTSVPPAQMRYARLTLTRPIAVFSLWGDQRRAADLTLECRFIEAE